MNDEIIERCKEELVQVASSRSHVNSITWIKPVIADCYQSERESERAV